ncbi:uncharacterized protein A4U43_C01F24220 [Asparagus officinalis]|uniref:Agenet domain-containing protein n=1 Tax=Asparagus officinalis TaxID=4686 RepID=A0A5P1FRQ9_ASPOF|nr:uncharacterized protein A4U43_C01F24220 [Asparagus officinalis]
MIFKEGTKVEVLDKRELPSDVESTIDKVKRKAIRPCPPAAVEGLKCWVPGDIVEVYNNHSWKLGENSGKCCNGEIYMLPKEEKLIRHKPKPCLEENYCSKDSHLMVENDYPISQILLKYSKKRPHNCPLIVDSCTGAGKKIRRIDKEGIIDQVVAETSPNRREKGPKLEAVNLASMGPRRWWYLYLFLQS